jgi:PhoH-like ATPase
MAKSNKTDSKKAFVIDTSVILFDHNSIYTFDEHDVVVPISVLEEIDTFKKGSGSLNYEAREFSRKLDLLSEGKTLNDWLEIGNKTKGRLKVEMKEISTPDANAVFSEKKVDHKILNVAINYANSGNYSEVKLITKDINLRIKAKSLSLKSEDYEHGKIKDSDAFTGKTEISGIDDKVITKIFDEGGVPWKELMKNRPNPNEYFIVKNGSKSALSYFNAATDKIERVEKGQAFGIKPRNAEQVFALHAVLNPDVKLVTISGLAGTGKTLLALAGAIEMKRDYRQIYIARPIVPLGNKDIGYLPGDIKSKLNPYMEPLWDNLKLIQSQFKETDKDFKKINEMVEQEKIVISPLAYIRGRSLSNIIFIVDEAQNLTPHEVRTIISRAGENTKIILTGDINQIDTPYLDTQSNGLSYVIDRMSKHPIHAHITLERGERSELANVANELL